LYVIGTPIGNLSDASPRVHETFARCDLVFCEDTRVTRKLLSAFDIHTTLARADEHTAAAKVDELLTRLAAGEQVGFCSDAGMPAISDPGCVLVDAALEAGFPVEVIPGPSAVTCALAASGFTCTHFFFEGFLPRKAGEKRTRLAMLAHIPAALVIFESPQRVAATLGALQEVFGKRRVALVRELTKLHECCVRGTAAEVAAQLEAGEGRLRGECVLVVEEPAAAPLRKRAHPEGANQQFAPNETFTHGSQLQGDPLSNGALGAGEAAPATAGGQSEDTALLAELEAGARASLLGGKKASATAKELARAYGVSREYAYELVLRVKSAL
jgi:16S rRNA (cytidine1402-2'-O)-methyltransferase